MCTVLTLDQEKLFGRTMDFPPRDTVAINVFTQLVIAGVP